MAKQWKQCQILFFGAPKSLQMVTAAMKLKDAYSLAAKAYLSARSAAASRAYKKLKKGTGTKKGQVRKTARRAYMKK